MTSGTDVLSTAVKRGREVVREPRLYARLATWRVRMLPAFLIIGAAKGGTTSLYNYLVEHPQVLPASRKEVHYFDYRYDRGERYYRAHFPLTIRGRSGHITGEASPSYLSHPLVAARAHRLVPDARIIVLLRDPVERAFSHFRDYVRAGIETRSFEDAIREELEGPDLDEALLREEPDAELRQRRYSLIARGRYADQLERWFAQYERDRILILESESFFADPREVVDQVAAFLDLDQGRIPGPFAVYNQGTPAELSPAVRDEMRAQYTDDNRRLVEMLGCRYSWM